MDADQSVDLCFIRSIRGFSSIFRFVDTVDRSATSNLPPRSKARDGHAIAHEKAPGCGRQSDRIQSGRSRPAIACHEWSETFRLQRGLTADGLLLPIHTF